MSTLRETLSNLIAVMRRASENCMNSHDAGFVIDAAKADDWADELEQALATLEQPSALEAARIQQASHAYPFSEGDSEAPPYEYDPRVEGVSSVISNKLPVSSQPSEPLGVCDGERAMLHAAGMCEPCCENWRTTELPVSSQHDTEGRWTCPDCGYDSMPYPPKDYNICPKCLVEFGNDDRKSLKPPSVRLVTGNAPQEIEVCGNCGSILDGNYCVHCKARVKPHLIPNMRKEVSGTQTDLPTNSAAEQPQASERGVPIAEPPKCGCDEYPECTHMLYWYEGFKAALAQPQASERVDELESKCLAQARICNLENERLTMSGQEERARYWEGRSDAFQDCIAFVRALAQPPQQGGVK